MICSDVVQKLSEYVDGSATDEERALLEQHVDGCLACGRYRRVLEKGLGEVRALPRPRVGEDFAPRLRHRLYHLEDARGLAADATSGASAVTILGIALLLSVLAWSPIFFERTPVVELAPIVVDQAPRDPATLDPSGLTRAPGSSLDEGLWANTLLYDYSPLSQRYPEGARLRRAAGTLDR